MIDTDDVDLGTGFCLSLGQSAHMRFHASQCGRIELAKMANMQALLSNPTGELFLGR
jgi:hypothetical protein